MILGILVMVLTLGCAVALTRPWWRSAIGDRMSRERANVASYRLRIAEIDRELAAGAIDAVTADALKLEQQQRLVEDAQAPASIEDGRSPLSLAIGAAIFLPLFAGAWYYSGGSWRVADQIARAPAAIGGGEVQAAQIEGMVQRLAQRLEQQPNDADGWAMLGRSYFVLKRYPESAQAYARANALMQPPDPDLLVSEGGALGLATDGDLSGRPRELFEQALSLSPSHLRALWFSGQAALQAGEYDLAQARWERLLQQQLPEELRAEVEQNVHELAARTGRPAEIAAAPKAGSAAPAVGAKAAPATASPEGPTLRVKVALDPALAPKRKADQVLYVFAKAEHGPPMPLAVQKLRPDHWPVELTLDESMAMSPALKLSQFDRWIVTARLGGEGSPMAQSGDLQGQVLVTRGASPQNVDVVISEQVP